MVDNQDRMRHNRVSQHASIYRKRVWPSQPSVNSSLVDVEAQTSRVQASPGSSSRRRHMSSPDASKAPPIQFEEPNVNAFVSEEFRGGVYNLSQLSLYVGHAARHMRDKDKIYLHLFSETNVLWYSNILTIIYFSAVPRCFKMYQPWSKDCETATTWWTVVSRYDISIWAAWFIHDHLFYY